jgi:hypothetical protein
MIPQSPRGNKLIGDGTMKPTPDVSAPPNVDLVEAAARLKIYWHTAHRWVLIGRLRGHREHGRWKVDAADLDRLIAEQAKEQRARRVASSE